MDQRQRQLDDLPHRRHPGRRVSASRLANLGIGHGAIDAGGGYTYLNDKTGLEFSAVAGVTYNWENTHTNYKNGIDSHLDWAVSQFLSANWEVGVVGYVYYQLTGDSGSGDRVGPFKSRVASVGPEVGYAFKFGGQPAYFNCAATGSSGRRTGSKATRSSRRSVFRLARANDLQIAVSLRKTRRTRAWIQDWVHTSSSMPPVRSTLLQDSRVRTTCSARRLTISGSRTFAR